MTRPTTHVQRGKKKRLVYQRWGHVSPHIPEDLSSHLPSCWRVKLFSTCRLSFPSPVPTLWTTWHITWNLWQHPFPKAPAERHCCPLPGFQKDQESSSHVTKVRSRAYSRSHFLQTVQTTCPRSQLVERREQKVWSVSNTNEKRLFFFFFVVDIRPGCSLSWRRRNVPSSAEAIHGLASTSVAIPNFRTPRAPAWNRCLLMLFRPGKFYFLYFFNYGRYTTAYPINNLAFFFSLQK